MWLAICSLTKTLYADILRSGLAGFEVTAERFFGLLADLLDDAERLRVLAFDVVLLRVRGLGFDPLPLEVTEVERKLYPPFDAERERARERELAAVLVLPLDRVRDDAERERERERERDRALDLLVFLLELRPRAARPLEVDFD